jgi:hypothetical protein
MPLFYHAPVWNERRTSEKLFYSNRPSGVFFKLIEFDKFKKDAGGTVAIKQFFACSPFIPDWSMIK